MKKLAVLIPGIGYTKDKPLLYYSSKIARAKDYDVLGVTFHDLPDKIRGDNAKIKEAYLLCCEQTKEFLGGIDFSKYDRVVFISKSIGTIVAAYYCGKNQISAKHIFFTPLEQTFNFVGEQESIVFYGNADPWADDMTTNDLCKKLNIPSYLVQSANHSLETGDISIDINNLLTIMKRVNDFLESTD